jgi:hypothetical protein
MGGHASSGRPSTSRGAEKIGASEGGGRGDDESPSGGSIHAPWPGTFLGDWHPWCGGVPRGRPRIVSTTIETNNKF